MGDQPKKSYPICNRITPEDAVNKKTLVREGVWKYFTTWKWIWRGF